MWTRLLVVVLPLAAARVVDRSNSSVCNVTRPASQRLRHFRPLRIASISGYDTYSAFDADGVFITNTYDASLLAQLQVQLGFSYEPVVEISRTENTTWNEFVASVLNEDAYDMVLTYWSRNNERQDAFSIPAHTHNHRIIVVSRLGDTDDSGELPTWDTMWDFFWSPFSNRLWYVFFSLFAVNAVGQYLVEYDHDKFEGRSALGGLGLSLYFSFTLLTGACDFTPNTAAGRSLFAAWGICIVLSLAWYTGDLAGSQAADKLGTQISTISELVDAGLVVCYPTSRATNSLGELDPLENEIVYHAATHSVRTQAVQLDVGTSTSEQILAMEAQMASSGGCSAMIVPEKGYDELLRTRQQAESCDAHPAYRLAEPLVTSLAGWAVSYDVSGCLVPALMYGLQALKYTPQIGGTDVMRNLEDQFLKSACDWSAEAQTNVRLSHLGLAYFCYLAIFACALIAALIKKYHSEYCTWMPTYLTPTSSHDLHGLAHGMHRSPSEHASELTTSPGTSPDRNNPGTYADALGPPPDGRPSDVPSALSPERSRLSVGRSVLLHLRGARKSLKAHPASRAGGRRTMPPRVSWADPAGATASEPPPREGSRNSVPNRPVGAMAASPQEQPAAAAAMRSCSASEHTDAPTHGSRLRIPSVDVELVVDHDSCRPSAPGLSTSNLSPTSNAPQTGEREASF